MSTTAGTGAEGAAGEQISGQPTVEPSQPPVDPTPSSPPADPQQGGASPHDGMPNAHTEGVAKPHDGMPNAHAEPAAK